MNGGSRARWVAAYFALMAVWVYGVLDRSAGYGSDAKQLSLALAAGAAHVALGVAIGRWWVVLLPLGVILLAVPAGYADRGELPIWLGFALIQAPIAAALLGAGAFARRVLAR